MHQAQLHAFSGLYTLWLQRQLQAHLNRSSRSSSPPPFAFESGMTPPLTPPPPITTQATPTGPTATITTTTTAASEIERAEPAEMTTKEEEFVVPPAFQSPTADLVLVSIEGIELRAHKFILGEASGFFRRMFEDACPDPTSTSLSTTSPDPSSISSRETVLERIPWPEPARTILALLQHIYPYPLPSPTSSTNTLEETLRLLLAADKWELALPLQSLKSTLFTHWLPLRPLRVYGFLCSSGLATPGEIERAALACLESCDPRSPASRQDLAGMSALDLARLLDARDARAALAQQVVERDVPSQCPHGFPLATSGLVGRWKAALGERLGRNPVGKVLDGWESVGEVLWPEGVAGSCRLCIPAEARRTCLEKVAKVRRDIDALPLTL